MTADSLRAWLAGLDPIVIPVMAAIAVALAVAALASFIPESRPLDQRLRALSRSRGDAAANGGTPQPRIPGRLAMLDALQNMQSEWLARSTGFARKRMRLLSQAGLRGPRALLMLEGGRLLLAVGLPLALFLALRSSDAFVFQPLRSWGLVAFAAVFGFALPDILLRNRINKRRAAFQNFWDDAIGLLIICLDAGLSMEVAMRRIARELALTAPVVAEELMITVSDLSFRRERRLAYMELAERVDLPSVKSVTIALIQAEKQGASIAQSLRTISQGNRDARIARAEEKAAALGPKMTIPMILFFLPVLFVVIIAPVFINAKL